MFFKVTETCTIDTSDRYVNGESETHIFEANHLASLEDYFADLMGYNLTHGLKIDIEKIEDDEVESALEANGCFEAINIHTM